MDYEKRRRKMQYIPMFARGEISERECARMIGIKPVSVWRLKKRYLRFGNAIWVHGNTGRTPQNRKYDYERIRADYRKFDGTPFMSFRWNCADYLHYAELPSYSTIRNVLTSAGIASPRARVPARGRKHLPRLERPSEGDMIQIDASSHDWFMNGHRITLHGAIDDATHKIVALYFCENECLLGYYQLLRQILARTGGLPRAIYSDRSRCFFARRGDSSEELVCNNGRMETQWQRTCRELQIELIAAYSPQAKGRIERLWQTLQGQLPFIFRHLGIATAEKANAFLGEFIARFNKRFTVPARDPAIHWKTPPFDDVDFEYLFSVRINKRTRADGSFIYRGFSFRIDAPGSSRASFTLCLSESAGIRARVGGAYFPVVLTGTSARTVSAVVGELIRRSFLADTHSEKAVSGAG